MSVLVILDTNALHGDANWQKPPVRRLLALCRRGLIRLAVSAVTLMELERQRSVTIDNKMQQLEAIPRKMEDALVDLGLTTDEAGLTIPDLPNVTREQILWKYHEEMASLIEANNVEVLAVPEVSHSDLLERDLAATPPFRPNGKGYRDALIWMGVLERCAGLSPDDQVYFVTQDGDFGTLDLHPELREELPWNGHIFTRVESIENLLEQGALQEPSLNLQKVLEMAGPNTIEEVAKEAIKGHLDRLSGLSVDDVDSLQALNVPREVDDVDLDEVRSAGELAWQLYDELNRTTVLGEGSLEVLVALRGTVDKRDAAVLADDEMTVESWDGDQAVVLFERAGRASFDLRVEVLGENVEVHDIQFLGFKA